MTVTVACIQNTAGPDVEANIAETTALVREAAGKGAELVALPEYFSALASEGPKLTMPAFEEAAHPALPAFTALSKELGLWSLLGSLPIAVGGGRVANRGYLIDPDGAIAARYDKVHLFDVDLPSGEQYRESATIEPGGDAVLGETPWGKIGMSICYDLRFPQLFRTLAQAGASILTVPAAFTKITGEAHWHVLLRARAIENGCFVIAPCQCGEHEGGGKTFGHSLIIDPWGKVLADGGEKPGVVLAEIDPAEVARVRAMVPSLTHDRAYDPPSLPSVRAAE